MNTKEWNSKFIMYRRTIKQLKESVNHDLSAKGISLQHATYLLLLADNGGLMIKQLSELSDNDAALTSRILKYLLEKRLVARTCANVRRCQIVLTAQGAEVVAYIDQCFERIRNEYAIKTDRGEQGALLSVILS